MINSSSSFSILEIWNSLALRAGDARELMGMILYDCFFITKGWCMATLALKNKSSFCPLGVRTLDAQCQGTELYV
jgi:hypothetical protein